MKKLLIMSDNHGDRQPLDLARKYYQNQTDYMIHCGDCCLPMDCLKSFLAVPGNMDHASIYPSTTILLPVEGHQVMIEHGHQLLSSSRPDYSILAKDAIRHHCDIVIFGHTHRYLDTVIDGIRLLNPGTCNASRTKDSEIATYMLVTIDKDMIQAEKKPYISLLLGEV